MKCGSPQIYGIIVPWKDAFRIQRLEEPQMNYIPVGLDIAEHVIQLHMFDFHTGEMVDKQIKRDALLTFFANREPCLIGMEACGGSPH